MRIVCFVVATLLLAMTNVVFALDEDEEVVDVAARKAQRAHDLAASDMIYQQEDFRALYYQNQQIITLLKEMSDTLHQIREQGVKTEEKS